MINKMNFPPQQDIFQIAVASIYGFFLMLTYGTFRLLKWGFPKGAEMILNAFSNWVDARADKRFDEKFNERFDKVEKKLHEIKNIETGKTGSTLLMIDLMEGMYESIGDSKKYKKILKNNKKKSSNDK
tara:strand:- start:1292 stop:1675 length:384 start_codon:yes stop_codon:yes gene_type:complete